MGRKKSKRKPPPKKSAPKLDTTFTCPWCNHEKSCEVLIDLKSKVGTIQCRVCSEKFQTPVTYLSQPIDVYTDWIDACEEANAEGGPSVSGRTAAAAASARRGSDDEDDGLEHDARDDEDDDDDGDLHDYR